jgi:CheY-like chemotaxis protein
LELQRRLAAAGGARAGLPVVVISLDAAHVRRAALDAGAVAVVDKTKDGVSALAAAVAVAVRRPHRRPG